MYSPNKNIVLWQKKNRTLSGNDYAFSGLWKWISGNILGYEYDQAISLIATNANWNAGIGCYPISWKGESCYRVAKVDDIISTYMNLAKTMDIPEYDRQTSLYLSEIVSRVATVSGNSEEQVKAVLDELYYSTTSGAIKTTTILYPLSSFSYDPMKDTPDEADSAKGLIPIITDNIQKALFGNVAVAGKTIMYLGLAGFAICGCIYIKRRYKPIGNTKD